MTQQPCWVALYGPDGSGKSTVADLLADRWRARGIDVQRRHWRPRLLPGIRGRNAGRAFADRPTEVAVRPRWVSAVLVLVIWLDFLLAALRFRLGGRRAVVLLSERHFPDVLVHPARYGLAPPRALVRLLVRLLPHPDGSVVLVGDPDTLLARKRELPREEMCRQLALYNTVFPLLPRVRLIDVTHQRPDAVALAVEQHLGLAPP